MNKLITLCFCLLVLPMGFLAQTEADPAIFDIIHKDKKVGTVHAWTSNEDGATIYNLKTEITKKVAHVKHCLYTVKATFINDTFTSSNYELYINEKLDNKVEVFKDGQKLKGSKKGKKAKVIDPVPSYISALFFFKEPTGVGSTYSESKLKSRKLKPHKKKEHTYILGNNSGEYQYLDGKLMRMIMKDVVTVEMVRRD